MMADHGLSSPIVGSSTYQSNDEPKHASKKKNDDVVDTIRSCDLGYTIRKKKQKKGANPMAADPHTKAVASTPDEIVIIFVFVVVVVVVFWLI
jgi:hypothetical protein